MNALVLFLALDFALVAGAVVLLLAVILRRGRSPQYLALAMLLIALAVGVWYSAIRTPPVLP
jgi:ABC-type proline/glycine betaine transport system permease subunit